MKYFETVFRMHPDKYEIDAPLVLVESAIIKDTVDNKTLLRNVVLNTGERAIKAFVARIAVKNVFGDNLSINNNEIYDYIYQDIIVNPGEYFGNKIAIDLPDDSRKVDVTVPRAVFENDDIWSSNPDNFVIIQSQREIEASDEYIEGLDSNRIKPAFYYVENDTSWQCTCGQPNRINNTNCTKCGRSKNKVKQLFNSNTIAEGFSEFLEMKEKERKQEEEKLRKLAEERKHRQEEERKKAAAEKRIREEEERKLREQAEEERKKILEAEEREAIVRKSAQRKAACRVCFLSFVAITIIIIIATFIIVPNKQYSEAQTLMDEGKFDEAIEVYTSLGDYKDSQENLLRAKYGKAKQYSKEEKLQAIALYKELGDYMDSKQLYELLNEELLTSAEKLLLDDEDYKSARKILVELNGYGNSEELLKQCDEQEKVAKSISILVDDVEDDTIHLENNNNTTGYGITIAPGKEAFIPGYVYLTIEFPDGKNLEPEKIEMHGSSYISCSALLPENLTMPGIVIIRLHNDKKELISEKKIKVVGELPEFVEKTEEEPLIKEDLETIYSSFSDYLESYNGNIIADLNEGFRIVFHISKDSPSEKTIEDIAKRIGANRKDNAYIYDVGRIHGNNFTSVRAKFDVDDQHYRMSVYKNSSEEYCGVTIEKDG